jgi:DNA-directed RNA polymerase subunit RPC12/RpoP
MGSERCGQIYRLHKKKPNYRCPVCSFLLVREKLRGVSTLFCGHCRPDLTQQVIAEHPTS